jgi:hypothetical protein
MPHHSANCWRGGIGKVKGISRVEPLMVPLEESEDVLSHTLEQNQEPLLVSVIDGIVKENWARLQLC